MQSVINISRAEHYNWYEDARPYSVSSQRRFSSRQNRASESVRPSDRSLFAWFVAHSEAASRIGFVACVIFYGLTAAYGMSRTGQWDELRQSLATRTNELALMAGLEVKAVQVEGQHHLKETEIAAALGPREGVSIFAFDTDAARERLKRNGWVAEARVMRLLPSTLVVELEERTPFALWREGGKLAAIDRSGKVLSLAERTDFPNLRVVSGAGAAAPAGEIVDALNAVPELARPGPRHRAHRRPPLGSGARQRPSGKAAGRRISPERWPISAPSPRKIRPGSMKSRKSIFACPRSSPCS